MQAVPNLIFYGMLHGLSDLSAVYICSANQSLTSVGTFFYVRSSLGSLLADEGSAGLRSHETHRRLSDKETVNADRKSCESIIYRM